MFNQTVKSFRPVRYKGYDIFLDMKINGVLVATCMHDSNDKYFHHKFMDYTKKEAVAILKEKIDGGF